MPAQQQRNSSSSRERNRIHARKTRQRKKEQMQNLQERAQELKQEQLCLKQIINEKNTASILVGLFATSTNKAQQQGQQGEVFEDPRVEALLRRSVEDIPDATKIPELPALILPGQHASRKARAEAKNCAAKDSDLPNDGIDYDLLGKDRSKCTPDELDRIRRERNRMHAKRTRDRKRMYMEEMGEMCRQLEEENDLLLNHLKDIDPEFDESKLLPKRTTLAAGPAPLTPRITSSAQLEDPVPTISSNPSVIPTTRGVVPSCNHLKTLLEVAGSFERKQVSTLMSVAISAASDSDSLSSMASQDHSRPTKRVRSK